MLNPVHPFGAIRLLGEAPEQANETRRDLPDYSQAVLAYEMGVPIGAAIRKMSVSNTGEATVLGWWDYERETWAADFDAARHLMPAQRPAAGPSHFDWKTQLIPVPYKPFSDPSVILTIYLLDEAGSPTDVFLSLSRAEVGAKANLST